ncbi:uncharacterized protein LAESUDRAFT_721845 [Laetiporus sulphureus 93-53]|uniref:Secreted protein n=1 Tax=Laetiporus sulphureus 93-53 TaxID=1314785 RepID=A0A165GKI8_9APHY|nr:uncharacterized protein LAESUDRAFT_721845 [Laetiporus sulphureus 93-53]KZT10479.1 hypothetical protein LAESUDRAFT_721845 [Laetiporus sulphureus 93-53]
MNVSVITAFCMFVAFATASSIPTGDIVVNPGDMHLIESGDLAGRDINPGCQNCCGKRGCVCC